eukprot:PhF_6_TR32416/c0_g1_i1/m.48098
MNQPRVDVRSGLRIVSVPPNAHSNFAKLDGALIHSFHFITKTNGERKIENRVLIVSDNAVYVCTLDSGITRCILTKQIQSLFISQENNCNLGVKTTLAEYDMYITFPSFKQRDEVIALLVTTTWVFMGCRLPVRKTATDAELFETLELAKPRGWVLRITPIKSISTLDSLVREWNTHEENTRHGVEEEFRRLRNQLVNDVEGYKNEQWHALTRGWLDKINQNETSSSGDGRCYTCERC